MSVEINPSAQLGFPRPLTQVVKRSIYVSNSNSQPVAFKVKTTAPKQYCVRPNSGRVEPGERVEVQVLLQPLKEEPPLNFKCRDKFLIQSAVISADKETLPINEFWAMQEGDKQSISEHKIRCVFLPASSEPLPEENEDLSSVGAGAVGAGAVGAGAVGAGAGYMAAPSSGNGNVQPPISIASLSNMSPSASSQPVSASLPYAGTSSLPASSGVSSSIAAPSSSLTNRALSPQDLEAENARLRAQLASGGSGFRTATQKTSSGVPVHIVAAIAVAVFAITYLFF
ncbi:phosphatidylinositol-binding protein scs2 [Malassezia caprae]|uniref:Phosphatidylinositol-binding protein scs2 n=1 Tax=Malassezia caprae TaxID=1381934 RepID=A0AAF0EB72_9BASI|nr:phosphatidylinositol-binding protein scs2 [Malassezia caprae]